MTTHLEAAKARIARVRQELLQEAPRKRGRPRKKRSYVRHVITMDEQDGLFVQSMPQTVREAIEGVGRTVKGIRKQAVLGVYYGNRRRTSDDRFDRFLAVLDAFPDDLQDKFTWYGQNSPYYSKNPPPLFRDMHALLLADGVGPKTVLRLKQVFCTHHYDD